MKIAYIAHVNFTRHSGVAKKILGQTQTWRDWGHQAKIFWLTKREDLKPEEAREEVAYLYKGGPFSKERLRALNNLINDVLAWKPDIAYLRRDMVYPAFVTLARSTNLVIEINSDELAEIRQHSKLRSTYHYLTRPLLDKWAKGFVFPTMELAESPYFAKWEVPKCVIANGVVLDSLPVLEPPNNPFPVLVFIGTPGQPWHGVDKILAMAHSFPEWTFHVIGPSPSDLTTPPPNVIAHGFLAFEQYLPIMAGADVAIGTLALHRNQMNEASPLKTREYLALGLPVIIGYRDTDFPQGAPFILQLPNTEDNVQSSLPCIRSFVENWRGKRVPRQEVMHIDVKFKERARLKCFVDVLRKATGGVG